MLPKLILLQFSAHLLADFVFQDQRMSDIKKNKVFSVTHLWHFFIVWGCAYFLSLDFNFLWFAFFIAILHLLVDISKSWLSQKFSGRNFFFADQAFHLLVIVFACWFYTQIYGLNQWWEVPVKIVAVITGFILCAKPSNIIIQHLFLSFKIQTPDENGSDSEDISLPNAGKLIGLVERTLALALILIQQYSAVGLIIAAKSILRFKGTQKSEYVLVGTLLSFAIATLCGILINMI
jgi:hypothetical protein